MKRRWIPAVAGLLALVVVLAPSMARGQGAAAAAATPHSGEPAQDAPAGLIAAHPEWPKARRADVDSIDHIVAAVYDVISGPAGQQRNWSRMRSLFVPDARLVPIRPAKDGRHSDVVILTIDGFIARSSGNMSANGFFEHSLHNEVEQFGNIAQVWSTYESRHMASDAKPFARGINSFQLVKDGERYWVVQVLWDSERPDSPIPERYLR